MRDETVERGAVGQRQHDLPLRELHGVGFQAEVEGVGQPLEGFATPLPQPDFPPNSLLRVLGEEPVIVSE